MEIHCNPPTPPTCGPYCFFSVDAFNCKVYVPKGSYSSYSNTEQWEDFYTILEEDVQALPEVNFDNISIIQISNGIQIDSPDDVTVQIYTISGERIFTHTVCGNTQIPLERGNYVIKIGDKPKNSIKVQI